MHLMSQNMSCQGVQASEQDTSPSWNVERFGKRSLFKADEQDDKIKFLLFSVWHITPNQGQVLKPPSSTDAAITVWKPGV